MKPYVLMIAAIFVITMTCGCVSGLVQSSASPSPVPAAIDNFTGTWMSPFGDYVYRFYSDGTFVSEGLKDPDVEDVRGTWEFLGDSQFELRPATVQIPVIKNGTVQLANGLVDLILFDYGRNFTDLRYSGVQELFASKESDNESAIIVYTNKGGNQFNYVVYDLVDSQAVATFTYFEKSRHPCTND